VLADRAQSECARPGRSASWRAWGGWV